MNEFKQHQRIQIAELRPVSEADIRSYENSTGTLLAINGVSIIEVSISVEDLANGSPKIGDMIARNPQNHNDQWLVAEQYYKDNFKLI